MLSMQDKICFSAEKVGIRQNCEDLVDADYYIWARGRDSDVPEV